MSSGKNCLQEVELLVLIDHLLGKLECVQGLASQGEHCLSVYIAALCDASAGRITLCNKDGGLFLTVVLSVVIMDAAVTQLTVVEVGLLGTFTGLLGDTCHLLALALTLLDLGL